MNVVPTCPCTGYLGYPFQYMCADDEFHPYLFLIYPPNGQAFPHCSFPSYFRTDIPSSQYSSLLLLEAGLACEIAIVHQILHEALIGHTRRKIATASHAQGLIDRFFETKMRLLDVAILIRVSAKR
jgi:hypothetical protein